MKKLLSVLVIGIMTMAVSAFAQGKLAPAILPQADILAIADVGKISDSAFGQAVMEICNAIKGEEWFKKMKEEEGEGFKLSKDAEEFCEKIGIPVNDKAFKTVVFSLSLNGASAQELFAGSDSALDKLSFLFATEFLKPVKFEAIPGAVADLLKNTDQEKFDANKIAIKPGQLAGKPCITVDIMDEESELPAQFRKIVLVFVTDRIIVVGAERDVTAAVARFNAGEAAPLAPYFQTLKNDGFIAIRMLPEMKDFFAGQAAEMPALSKISEGGQGFAITCDAKENLALSFGCTLASNDDAMVLKSQLWDTQLAPMAGFMTAGLKEQYKGVTALDSLRGVADNNIFKVTFTISPADVKAYFEVKKQEILNPPKADAEEE